MAVKTVIEKRKGKIFSESINIIEPGKIKAALSPISWKILNALSREPDFTINLSRKLKIHEQKLYYHVNQLKKSGLISVVKQEVKQGALCKFYAPTYNLFGIELEKSSEEKKQKQERETQIIEKEELDTIKSFFSEFIESGIFDGSFVVGSPTPHGPHLTAARDGHYSIHLAMFLGNFCNLVNRYIVKLDTEVKAENSEKRNMIIVGGPITNILSEELNNNLKIRFVWDDCWKIFSEIKNKKYIDEDIGIIAKIKNPWDIKKTIILIAGLKFEGTKTSIIALTQHSKKLLKNYDSSKKEFFALVRGLDRDGDGKTDDIEVLESF